MDEENKNTTSDTEKVETTPEVKPVEEKKETTSEVKKEEKPKKKKKIGFIVSIIFILLAIIGGGVGGAVYAIMFAKTEVDLSKYVSIEFEGYEGYASFTEDDLIVDEKGLKKVLESRRTAEKLAERLLEKAEVEENSELKNGDTIEVKFKVSENWLKENKIKLTSDKIKIKVKDLEEPNSLDLFKDIEFSYSGISPNLTVTLTNNSDDNFIKNKVTFSMETEENSASSYSLTNIANGDKITVTATYSESDLQDAGYVVTEDEFEFEVKGQAEYIISSDGITEDIKSTINEKALAKAKTLANNSNYDVYNAYPEDYSDISNYDYEFSHTDPVLEKMYIAINKDLEDVGYYDARNIVYCVYKTTFTDAKNSKTYDYYICVQVNNLVKDSEGLSSDQNYYYNEFDNYSYDTSDGKDYHRKADEVYNSILNDIEDDYTLTEVK